MLTLHRIDKNVRCCDSDLRIEQKDAHDLVTKLSKQSDIALGRSFLERSQRSDIFLSNVFRGKEPDDDGDNNAPTEPIENRAKDQTALSR